MISRHDHHARLSPADADVCAEELADPDGVSDLDSFWAGLREENSDDYWRRSA